MSNEQNDGSFVSVQEKVFRAYMAARDLLDSCQWVGRTLMSVMLHPLLIHDTWRVSRNGGPMVPLTAAEVAEEVAKIEQSTQPQMAEWLARMITARTELDRYYWDAKQLARRVYWGKTTTFVAIDHPHETVIDAIATASADVYLRTCPENASTLWWNPPQHPDLKGHIEQMFRPGWARSLRLSLEHDRFFDRFKGDELGVWLKREEDAIEDQTGTIWDAAPIGGAGVDNQRDNQREDAAGSAKHDLTFSESDLWNRLANHALSPQDLAQQMDTSKQTIKEHVRSIRIKRSDTAITTRNGRLYYRPDAPPDWTSVLVKPIRRARMR